MPINIQTTRCNVNVLPFLFFQRRMKQKSIDITLLQNYLSNHPIRAGAIWLQCINDCLLQKTVYMVLREWDVLPRSRRAYSSAMPFGSYFNASDLISWSAWSPCGNISIAKMNLQRKIKYVNLAHLRKTSVACMNIRIMYTDIRILSSLRNTSKT